MSILLGLGRGMELLVGFTGIGGHDMIASEEVEFDLLFLVLPKFVEDGLEMRSSKTASDGFACGSSNCSALEDGASCSFAETSVDAEARESKNRSKGLQ